MVFYALLGIYFFFSFVKLGDSSKSKKMVVFFCILPLFLLTALRDKSIGVDTVSYYNVYYNFQLRGSLLSAISASWMEPGYVTLAYLLSNWNISYYVWQCLVAAFTYFSFGRFLYKYSTNIPMACYLLLVNNYVFGIMNVSRMWIAVAILLFSTEYIRQRKPIGFFVIVFIASMFHYSAVLFSVMYFLCAMKATRKRIFMVFCTSIGIYLFAMPFFTYVTNLIGLYGNYLTKDRFDMSDNIATRLSLAVTLLYFCLACYTRMGREYIRIDNKKQHDSVSEISMDYIAYIAIIIAVAIEVIGLSNNIMGRVIYYFSVFWLFRIPEILRRINLRGNRMLVTFALLVLLLVKYCVIMTYRPEWYQVTPYRFFFQA